MLKYYGTAGELPFIPRKPATMQQLDFLGDCLGRGLHKCAALKLGRSWFPYGMWIDYDGRQVLFSRSYLLLWERLPDGWVQPANPYEYIDIKQRELFFDDWTERYRQYKGMKRLRAVLVEWGFVKERSSARWHEFKRNKRSG